MTRGERAFWEFVVARQAAYWRRERGDGPPYSDDPVLAKFHFCNVYREADRGTRWFQAHRRRRGARGLGLEFALWDSVTYRLVNRVATFEAFGGIPAALEIPRFLRFLRAEMRAGAPVFTGRHFVKGVEMYERSLRHFDERLEETAATVRRAGSLRDAARELQAAPGVGPFFSWQILCDLLECRVLPEHLVVDSRTWALLGPGALRGAALVDPGAPALDVARSLVLSQPTDGSLVPPPEAPGPMSLKNVEHSACEFARYARARESLETGESAGLEVKPWAKR